jgi:hypothetical protein
MQGAAEAYSCVLDLLQQQEQQQVPATCSTHAAAAAAAAAAAGDSDAPQPQQLRIAAHSNRAACWLALNEYERCVADCRVALGAILLAPTDAPAAASGALDVTMLLQQRPPQRLCARGASACRSAARLAARLAAACGCQKQLGAADAAYAWAAGAWRAAGEPRRAAAIEADRQVVAPARGGGAAC